MRLSKIARNKVKLVKHKALDDGFITTLCLSCTQMKCSNRASTHTASASCSMGQSNFLFCMQLLCIRRIKLFVVLVKCLMNTLPVKKISLEPEGSLCPRSPLALQIHGSHIRSLREI